MAKLKIALCQINTTVGDFRHNEASIRAAYAKAVELGAQVVAVPELSTTGYPPQDLLFHDRFIRENLQTVERLKVKTGAVPLVVGHVGSSDGKLHNSAAVLQSGKIAGRYDKVLLPTYDVFDEARYFAPGTSFDPITVSVDGRDVRLGIQICEDLWDADYSCKVAREVASRGAEILINISASPFHEGKRFVRKSLVQEKAKELALPYLYCNLVGAQDELIFDGHSLAFDARGEMVAEGPQFDESVVMVELEKGCGIAVEERPFQREKELFEALVLGIRDYFSKTGHCHGLVGLSGGVDSALTVALAAEALGNAHVTAVAMPSRFNSPMSLSDARTIAETLGVRFWVIPIDRLASEFDVSLGEVFSGTERGLAEENLQARVRGNLLMAISNKHGYLLLSTGNKTELALGYCTLYGDMSGGLAAISDLGKTDVYALANWYNEHRGSQIIPANVLTRPPSAELSEGQVDPFDYAVVSPLVDEIVEGHGSVEDLVEKGYDRAVVNRIMAMVRRGEFKRWQAAPGLRVTTKAFGMGRRYPIVNHFAEEKL